MFGILTLVLIPFSTIVIFFLDKEYSLQKIENVGLKLDIELSFVIFDLVYQNRWKKKFIKKSVQVMSHMCSRRVSHMSELCLKRVSDKK